MPIISKMKLIYVYSTKFTINKNEKKRREKPMII
jgi:hypothetical protein